MLERAVAGVVAEDPAAFVIDLSGVQYLSAAGLQILAATREKIGETVHFAVVAQALPSRVIRLTNLDEFLSLHESLEDALTAVAAAKTR